MFKTKKEIDEVRKKYRENIKEAIKDLKFSEREELRIYIRKLDREHERVP